MISTSCGCLLPRTVSTPRIATAAAILDACDLLVDHPHIGHTRTDLTDRPVLFWAVGST